MDRKRLFIVSNRLPICISGSPDETAVSPESGQFVDSINNYLDYYRHDYSQIFWAGIPGCSPSTWNEATNHLDESRFTYIPVLVYKEQYDRYYNGFSNSVLRPLFHSINSETLYNEHDYQHYIQVNEHFSEILTRHCRKDDVVWIDGYNLLFLPAMLRRQLPGLTIGTFLQFQFPSYHNYSKIAESLQHAIIEGITASSFIGFRGDADRDNFLECVSIKKDISSKGNVILIKERPVPMLVLPVNSDFNKLDLAADFSLEKTEVP